MIVEKQVKPTMNKIKIDIPNIDLPTIAGGGPFLGNWAGNPSQKEMYCLLSGSTLNGQEKLW